MFLYSDISHFPIYKFSIFGPPPLPPPPPPPPNPVWGRGRGVLRNVN